MNASHGTVLVGGTALITALTTLLTGSYGLDAAHAGAAAFIVVNGFSAFAVAFYSSRLGVWLWPR
jgi:hypothetical protein